MVTKDEALKLALEALESGVTTTAGRISWVEYDSELIKQAITAIKEVLAQPEQGPNAMRQCQSCDGTGERLTGIDEVPTTICKPCSGTGQIAIATPPEPPPISHPWVGLTAANIKMLIEQARIVPTQAPCPDYNVRLIMLTNAVLKELNT